MNDMGFFDDSGKWQSENPDGFRIWLNRHAHKRAVLKLEKWYKRRTDPENKYMHWLFNFIGEHTGDRGEDLKGWYKVHFKIGKTSSLSTLEMEKFLEDVRRHAQEFHGIRCPLPNEVIYE